ncbi:hypothetical protein Hanom_Chr03g00203781 [Helianthus anomalus]
MDVRNWLRLPIYQTSSQQNRSSKYSSEDVNEDKKIEKPDPDVGSRKKKRIRIESGSTSHLKLIPEGTHSTHPHTGLKMIYRIRKNLTHINNEWDEKRASLENDFKVDKCLIHALHMNPSIRSENFRKKICQQIGRT